MFTKTIIACQIAALLVLVVIVAQNDVTFVTEVLEALR